MPVLGRSIWFAAPLALSLLAATPQPAHESPEVTFTVTAVEPGHSVQFEVQTLDAGLRMATHLERANAPYTLRLPGREAYAVFHQLAGNGMMRVEVRLAPNRTATSESHTILFVVRGDSAGATISRW